jgi:hypothetical protein
MAPTQKRNLMIGVAGGLLVVVLWLVIAGGGKELRDVGGESRDAREAMEVIQAIAADPRCVQEHMADDAASGNQRMVAETAVRMSEGDAVQFVSAGWWDGYMRLQVSWTSKDGAPLTRTFFLKKQDGRLRIRGLQL